MAETRGRKIHITGPRGKVVMMVNSHGHRLENTVRFIRERTGLEISKGRLAP